MILRELLTYLGFTADMKEADAYEKRIERIRESAEKMVATGAAISAPVILAVNRILGVAGEFEATINRVQAAGQFTADQMAALTDKVMELGAASVFSNTDVAASFEDLAKAGVSFEDLVGGLGEGVLNLAAALNAPMDGSGVLLNDVMKLFDITADKAGEVADKLVGVANASKLDFGGLKDAYAMAGSAAHGYGVSLDDLNAALVATANGFSGGSDQGTSFKTFVGRLVPSTKNAAAAMEQYGLKFTDANGRMKSMAEVAQILRDKIGGLSDEQRILFGNAVFGEDAIRMMNAMINSGAEGVNAASEAIRAQGDAVAGAEVKTKGYLGAMEALGGAIENLQIKIAESGLLEWATQGAQALTGIVEWLAKLDPKLLRFGTAASLAAAGFGVLITTLGALILLAGVVSWPLLLIAGAIALVVGGIAAFWPEVQKLWTAVGAGDWDVVFEMWHQAWRNMLDWIKTAFTELVTWLGSCLEWLLPSDIYAPIKSGFLAVIDALKSAWTAFVNFLPEGVRKVGRGIRSFLFGPADEPAPGAPANTNAPPTEAPAGANLPGYASGTRSARRGLALVGEEGAEIVDFGGGERVIPARQTYDILAARAAAIRAPLLAGLGAMAGAATAAQAAPALNMPVSVLSAPASRPAVQIGSLSAPTTVNVERGAIPDGISEERVAELIGERARAEAERTLERVILSASRHFTDQE
ncbi:MAG: phage tail tape measure protein [Rhodovulum sulfidophilum]|uniref:Phage tail tape measure protein n=1 Tax=Rhodovulum sulfidophilum TaxID=35806 RepID=A0A2W5PXY2_RHOSU|nr:MAG: phage tail tape measure protein [Rhodovulum sulfidophilum]